MILSDKIIKRILAFALCISLVFTMSGCKSILGDGEVNVVTAPPLVTPKVIAYDKYTAGTASKYDIGGTDAFYLLPGIENEPDSIQDFSCLDYTKDGYFLYYYCAPAYISAQQVADYALEENKEGEASTDPQTLDKSGGVLCDAFIFMAYNPDTRHYKIIDAQGFSKETANSQTGGNANTGLDFYASTKHDFFTLSHAFGCRMNGTSDYFIFDQNGIVKIYNEALQVVSTRDIGDAIIEKVKDIERNTIANTEAGTNISELESDLDDPGDDEENMDMDEALDELSEATGETFDTGEGKVDDLTLNCLIKSATSDSTGQIYLSMMVYSGESPWASEVLYDRVCSVTSVDLAGGFTNFVSINENYEKQVALYKAYAAAGSNKGQTQGVTMKQIREGFEGTAVLDNGEIFKGSAPDSFTPFFSDRAGSAVMILGLPIFTHKGLDDVFTEEQLRRIISGDLGNTMMREVSKMMSPQERLKFMRDTYKKAFNMLPGIGDFNYRRGIHDSDFPDKDHEWVEQILAVGDMGFNSKNTGAYRTPRSFPVLYLNAKEGDKVPFVYYEPYTYNSRISVYTEESMYIRDEEAALALRERYKKYLRVMDRLDEVADEIEKYYSENGTMEGVVYSLSERERPDDPLIFSGSYGFMIQDGVSENDFGFAFLGRVRTDDRSKYVENPNLTIPENTFPTSYRLVFPKGAYFQSADMDTAEGSATSSVPDGVLLFSDTAKQDKEGHLSYTSNMFYRQMDKLVLEAREVPGSAIDTGVLPYEVGDTGSSVSILMLITDAGVKFFWPEVVWGGLDNRGGRIIDVSYSNKGDTNMMTAGALFIKNEDLLSSTGFTPYTESATQEALSKRNDDTLPEERYKDGNSVQTTQKDMTLNLNSSRVGTLQSASSFTAMSNKEILMSAYDSGLSLLRLDFYGNENIHEVIHLQDGSYYQSFPSSKKGCYKVIGFDTTDYMYGTKDLVRAKVYDFDFDKGRDEIYASAIRDMIDQMAIDYVRRQYRTRVEIEEDDNGKPTGNSKVVTVPFEDDHSKEAESERRLFESDETTAKNELIKIEQAKGAASSEEAALYLMKIREKVDKQKEAMKEIFAITGATKLPSAGTVGTSLINDSDVYWVGLKERLQYTTEMGSLKEILAEIATAEELLSHMSAEDAATYRSLREVLNYKEEDEKKNKALEKVDLDAASLDQLIKNKKSASDYEEEYGSLNTDPDQKVTDPLEERINTDGVMDDGSKNSKMSRQKARDLILEDVENTYFRIYPLAPEKVYSPDGSYRELVTKEREDEVWEEYLNDLLNRINPDNLSEKRSQNVEEFAALSYEWARMAKGDETGKDPLKVSDGVKEKMRKEIMEGIDSCETIADMEALFFGTQIRNLGNPYGAFLDQYNSWAEKQFTTDAEKAKEMRAAEWYIKLKGIIDNDDKAKAFLWGKNRTWEDYLSSIMTNKTGTVLRDERTGESAGAVTTAASVFAQLVEFMCINAGNVDQETKIDMVEDLLIGMLSISGSNTSEEAVLVERMTLPSFRQYKSEYDRFNSKVFDDNISSGDTDDQDAPSITFSSGAALRRSAMLEEDFYKKVIVSMKEDPLVIAYLKENEQTWDQYMASLPVLAQNSNITDPAASARRVYETFEPFTYVDESNRPGPSDGSEERPVVQ